MCTNLKVYLLKAATRDKKLTIKHFKIQLNTSFYLRLYLSIIYLPKILP